MAQKIAFGISQKLFLTLLVVALIPLLVIWFFSYQSITALTSEKVNQELSAINDTLIAQVDDWVDMNQRMLLHNASLDAIRSMDAKRQNPVLTTMTKYYDWAYLAFTVDTNGNNIGRNDGKKSKYYGDREYFKQVVEGRQFGRQILIGKTSGKPAMVLSTGIFNDGGQLRGVLAQAMTLAELSGKIVSRKIGQTGFTFLVDEKDDIIAHPDAEMTKARVNLSNNPAVQAIKQGKEYFTFADMDGNQVVAVGKKNRPGLVDDQPAKLCGSLSADQGGQPESSLSADGNRHRCLPDRGAGVPFLDGSDPGTDRGRRQVQPGAARSENQRPGT